MNTSTEWRSLRLHGILHVSQQAKLIIKESDNAEDASCVVKLNLLSYLYDKTVNMTIQSYYDRLDSAESSKQWSLRIINYLSC